MEQRKESNPQMLENGSLKKLVNISFIRIIEAQETKLIVIEYSFLKIRVK